MDAASEARSKAARPTGRTIDSTAGHDSATDRQRTSNEGLLRARRHHLPVRKRRGRYTRDWPKVKDVTFECRGELPTAMFMEGMTTSSAPTRNGTRNRPLADRVQAIASWHFDSREEATLRLSRSSQGYGHCVSSCVRIFPSLRG